MLFKRGFTAYKKDFMDTFKAPINKTKVPSFAASVNSSGKWGTYFSVLFSSMNLNLSLAAALMLLTDTPLIEQQLQIL